MVRLILRFADLLFSVLLIASPAESQAVPDSTERILAIVVDPKNGTTDLTMDELRLIMKGDKKFWGEGRNVNLLMRDKGAWEREIVLETIFDMDEKAYSRFWLKQVYRGKVIAPPSVVASEEEMLKKVRDNANAIGYLDSARVETGGGARAGSDLVTVKIEGKKPSDSDYPLKKAVK